MCAKHARTNEEDDLQLRIRRQSIPLVRRAAGGSNVVEGDLAGELPREMELNGEGGTVEAKGLISTVGLQLKLSSCSATRSDSYVFTE